MVVSRCFKRRAEADFTVRIVDFGRIISGIAGGRMALVSGAEAYW